MTNLPMLPMMGPIPQQRPTGSALGGGMFGGFKQMMSPDMMMPIAAGLMSGRTNAEGFGNAFSAMGQGMQQRNQRNKTLDYLRQNDPEVAQLVEATGLDLKDAYAIHTQRVKAQKPGANLQAVGGHLYNTDTGEWISPPKGTVGADGTHGTPFYTRDSEGNLHVNFATKDGSSLVRAAPGEGETVLGPYDTAYQRSQGQVEGKGQGEAWESYNSMTSKMPGLKHVVGELDKLAETATYTWGGQLLDTGRKQLGLGPRDSAVARAEYTAIISNQILPLLRDTFGAQFTQKEGETLMRTLGDPDASPAEKQALLKAFIEQKQRDIEALALRTGVGGGGGAGAPGDTGTPDPLGIR